MPAGPYLVLPLFGPSSVRDSSGWVFSYFTSPTSYLSSKASIPLFGLNFVSARADLLGATDLLSQAALDKYSFVRDAYTQRRRHLLDRDSAPPNYGDAATRSIPRKVIVRHSRQLRQFCGLKQPKASHKESNRHSMPTTQGVALITPRFPNIRLATRRIVRLLPIGFSVEQFIAMHIASKESAGSVPARFVG